jgi:RNA polymerase sigma factor (TIGR02999 family)
MAASSVEITCLLRAWSGGDSAALEQLAPVIYAELRRIARGHMRHERPDHTLQATALVHEAYLHLIDVHNVQWQDRAHFFAVSAQMMRRILTDRARARVAAKRGGVGPLLHLEEIPEVGEWRTTELVALVSCPSDNVSTCFTSKVYGPIWQLADSFRRRT